MNVTKEEFIKGVTDAIQKLKEQRLAEIKLKKDGARQADDFLFSHKIKSIKKKHWGGLNGSKRWYR